MVGAEREVRSLSVWNDRIRVSFGRLLRRADEVPLSGCLRERIARFDALGYPELVRRAAAIGSSSQPAG